MAAEYTRQQIKLCVAKMCLAMGWHTSMTTPIEILTDILSNYLSQLSRTTAEYANLFGMTEPNLDHLGLAFRDFHINLSELEEFVKFVECRDAPALVPKYPLPKEDHLNFSGSQEAGTRPAHVHKYLPPMHPGLDVDAEATSPKEQDLFGTNPVFKRSVDKSPEEALKHPRVLMEEQGGTRRIKSVMMTPSGFLSPACEGRLPEARIPVTTLESTIPLTTSSPRQPQTVIGSEPVLNSSKNMTIKDMVAEADTKKLKRLKQISVKTRKLDKVLEIKSEVRQKSKKRSLGLITDKSASKIIAGGVYHLSRDVTIELVPASPSKKIPETVQPSNFKKDFPPPTLFIPKTPLERVEKRKRKDKSKVRKIQQPPRFDPKAVELNMEKQPFPFFNPFSGLGVIPPPLNNTPLGVPKFGQPPYLRQVRSGMSMNFMSLTKHEEPTPKKRGPVVNVPGSSQKNAPFSTLEIKSEEHKKDKKDKPKKKKKERKRKRDKIRKGEVPISKLSTNMLKLNMKPSVKNGGEPVALVESERKMCPELARISALVTGRPKPKKSTSRFK